MNNRNRKNGLSKINCNFKSIIYLRDDPQFKSFFDHVLQLNSDNDLLNVNGTNIKTLNVLCIAKNKNKSQLQQNNNTRNMKDCKYMYNYDNDYNHEYVQSILERMPCDVFLYSICNQYLNPNEIFRLLSVSKNIYNIITNKNSNNNNNNNNDNSLIHQLMSKQRLINNFLKLIDLFNDIANKAPKICQRSEQDGDN